MKEEPIFHQALEQPLEQRAAYLDAACGGDAELRERVDALLRAHENPGSFLAAPGVGVGVTVDQPMTAKPGTQIGPYKLRKQIGEGGFGVVYQAEQLEPVRRTVALKIVKPGMDSKQVIARFEAERQALALMDHPHIAHVLDAGTTELSRPYFVMELIKGLPITDYCDQCNLTTRERLELFVSVCQAVEHAHQKGVIHRDIKPSNVMISSQDGRPSAKVIDFGVAKAINQPLTERSVQTGFAQMLGTPLYMSPEQAEMSPLDVDTRADIYSLGVLLYELLTGTTPFEKERLGKASFDELRRIIREEEPLCPSARLSTFGEASATAAQHRRTDPRRLIQQVRGELDWIVMKALEKDRARRYETASAFAADIARYLRDEPVAAHPPSAIYRFRKFARRCQAALAMAAILLLAVGLAGGSVGWVLRAETIRAGNVKRDLERHLQRVSLLEERRQWSEALNAAKKAEELLSVAGGSQLLKQRLAEVIEPLKLVSRLEAVRAETMSQDVGPGSFNYLGAERRYAEVFREYGIDPVSLDGVRQFRFASMRTVIAAALDEWAAAQRIAFNDARCKIRLETAIELDPDPWRTQLRRAWIERDEAALEKLANSIPTDAPWQTVTLMARLLRDTGRMKQATLLLRDVQKQQPGDFWVNFELAWALSQIPPRPHDDVVRFYAAALAIRPHSAAARNNLGLALFHQGRVDQAVNEYRVALRLQPDHATIHNNLGLALQAKQQLDEAMIEFHEALRLRPDFAGAYTNLGNTLHAKGQLDKAIAALREAIRLEPKLAMAHNNLGNVLFAQEKLDEAIAEHRQAIHLDPKLTEAHNNLGGFLKEKGLLDDAIAAHQEAVRLQPLKADLHYNLGIVLETKGLRKKAAASYKRAAELNPSDFQAHFNLGVLLKQMNRVDEAIDAYLKAIRLNPNDAWFHINLGNAYFQKGLLSQAIEAYEAALQVQPRESKAYFYLGHTYLRQRLLPEAIDAYRKAADIEPSESPYYNNLGAALLQMGRLDEAIDAFHRAVDLDSKQARYQHNLSVALLESGRLSEALSAIEAAVRLQPRDPQFQITLGNISSRMRRGNEALRAYERAVQLAPEFPAANGALASCLAMRSELAAEDAEQAVRLAHKAVQGAPGEWRHWSAQGVAHYRLGRWQAAIESLEKSNQLHGGDGLVLLTLAMANWRQGNSGFRNQQLTAAEQTQRTQRAQSLYDKALTQARGKEPGELLDRFRSEAEELLGGETTNGGNRPESHKRAIQPDTPPD